MTVQFTLTPEEIQRLQAARLRDDREEKSAQLNVFYNPISRLVIRESESLRELKWIVLERGGNPNEGISFPVDGLGYVFTMEVDGVLNYEI